MSYASIEARDVIGYLPRAMIGGLIATIVFTLMMKFLAPMMIGHSMDIATVLGTFTGLGTSAGMVMHFLLGAIGYPVVFLIVGPYLSGPMWLRGVTFMTGVWLLGALIVMPILGVGLFFGGPREAMAALIGHVVFGAILGAIARLPSRHVGEQLL